MRRAGVALVGAQACGQLALIVVVPVITRSFAPSEFGRFQYAMAAALILQPLATLRMEFIIPVIEGASSLRRTERIARNALAFTCIVGLTLAAVLVLLEHQASSEVALMTVIIVAALAWTTIDNAVLLRLDMLKRLAWRNLLSGVISAALQLVLALVSESVMLLAAAILMGRGLAILATSGARLHLDDDPDTSGLVLRPGGIGYSVLSGGISTASLQSLPIYLGSAFSSAAAGYAGLAQRVAGAPFGLIGQGLTQYTQSATAPIIRSKQPHLKAAVRRQVRLLFVPAAIATVLMIALAPSLAEPILGPGWRQAGVVMAILAPAMSLQLVMSPMISIFLMLNHERSLFHLQLARLGGALGLAALGGAVSNDFYFAVGAFSAVIVAMYAVMYARLIQVIAAWEASI